jgi:hypothetical protein
VHFEQNGVPKSILLDMVEVARSHTGRNLGRAFIEVLESFKIKEKVSTLLNPNRYCYSPSESNVQILSITCDNASANDAMITYLGKRLKEFPGEANRTRCFAHVLNLVAKCIMKQFDAPKKHQTKKQGGGKDSDESDMDPDEALALASNTQHDALVEELEDEFDDEEIRVGDEGPSGRESMMAAEIEALEAKVKPVTNILTKVSHALQANKGQTRGKQRTDAGNTFSSSFGWRLMLWQTLALLSSQNGIQYLIEWLQSVLQKVRRKPCHTARCLVTLPHAGIPLMTCSTLPTPIVRPTIISPTGED